MKRLIGACAVFFIICGVFVTYAYSKPDNVLDYKTNGTKFVVVVIEENISRKEARKMGLERAAKIAYERGYKYFTVEKEDSVYVMRGKKRWPGPYDFPQNLYQEEIIERGFSRERFYQTDPNVESSPRKAVRFTIEPNKTKERKSHKVCDFIKCN